MPAPEHVLALPCWTGSVSATPLKGGLSNESWKVTDGSGAHVARFGADIPAHHVARSREAMVARAAHDAGFAPAVEYAGPGVMVCAYVGGRTWGEQDVRANPARIGALLKRFHHELPRHVEGTGVMFWPFHVIRDYARTLTSGHSAYLRDVPRLVALSDAFEGVQPPLPIVFGHHDLLPANFLDDGDRLWLIDFEYAGFGTAMFDLAGVAANAGMNDAESQALLAAYFGSVPGADIWRGFLAMQGAALVRETMWAMVSDLHLSAPGADYKAYAAENAAKLESFLKRYQQTYGTIET
jgi:thiamine kinase-like enzyme